MGEAAIELTILIPCLNEAETLGACIDAAQAFIARCGIAGEVLVADNASTDASAAVAAAHGAHVVVVERRGYGSALRGGNAAASGRYVVMGDADCSYDFERLDSFIERLRDGADLVVGNRFAGGIEPGAMPFLHRYVGNPALSFIGRCIYRAPVGDWHCGLRAYRRASIEALGLEADGMEYASEMVAKAALAGLRIEEVPTALRPDGRSGRPHLRTFHDGWRHLKLMWRLRPRS